MEKFDFTVQHPVIAKAYEAKRSHSFLELALMQATLDGDMQAFKDISEKAYGIPKIDVWYSVIHSVVSQEQSDENVSVAIKKLKTLLPALPEGFVPISFPSKELMEWVGKNLEGNFYELEMELIIDDEKTYNADEVKAIFDQALKNISSTFVAVITTTGKKLYSVSQEHKEVRIPSTVKSKGARIKKLLRHEVGTHVKRRENGERSAAQVLGIGLPGYLDAEEGLTMVIEQTITMEPVRDFAKPDVYLAFGLANGLDGKKRNFREVWEILAAYHTFMLTLDRKSHEDAERLGKSKGYESCFRIFRGTNSQTGVTFNKDLCYPEGNIKMWTYFESLMREGKKILILCRENMILQIRII